MVTGAREKMSVVMSELLAPRMFFSARICLPAYICVSIDYSVTSVSYNITVKRVATSTSGRTSTPSSSAGTYLRLRTIGFRSSEFRISGMSTFWILKIPIHLNSDLWFEHLWFENTWIHSNCIINIEILIFCFITIRFKTILPHLDRFTHQIRLWDRETSSIWNNCIW